MSLGPESDPHRGQPVLSAGAEPASARGVVIMIHGRGADAADILGLSEVLARPDFAYLAPEAAGHAWYPYRFLVPAAQNEPHLSSALRVVAGLIDRLAAAGLPAERAVLLGFSQGACLALEFAARNPRRYGGVLAFSGGLIGDGIDPAAYPGGLAGTPVFLGCSDVDPHIPLVRVRESAEVMRRLGGEVTERIYRGMAHTINTDEIEEAGRFLDRLT
jgi:phospholipase/carboxylesterase